jgi:hypothetical protein
MPVTNLTVMTKHWIFKRLNFLVFKAPSFSEHTEQFDVRPFLLMISVIRTVLLIISRNLDEHKSLLGRISSDSKA